MREKLKRVLDWNITDEDNDIFRKNELNANRIAGMALFFDAVIITVILLLSTFGVIEVPGPKVPYLILSAVEFLIPSVLCYCLKGRGKWIKYVLTYGLLFGTTAVFCTIGMPSVLLMLSPVVLSCRYSQRKFTASVILLTGLFLALGTVTNTILGDADLNVLSSPIDIVIRVGQGENIKQAIQDVFQTSGVDNKTLIVQVILRSVLPTELLYFVIAWICASTAQKNRNMMSESSEAAVNSARIESELTLATDIQANMLPNIFPAFPEHRGEFDVYATMKPAKEVGGDFYDFFMVDDTHLALVIGDVSGKGVPAALFMVTAKTLIKDYTQMGLEPADVFTRVNKLLCEGNNAGLFVTAWLGILDIKTGIMTYVNAGHNPPVCSDDGKFSFLKMKPGFVLAGLDSFRYKQATFKITPGEKLFLYTDGVTEAQNGQSLLYGDDRLLQCLESLRTADGKTVIEGIRADVDTFCDGATQFDDITMVILSFTKLFGDGLSEKIFLASDSEQPAAMQFIEDELTEKSVPVKIIRQVIIAAEELFVNVAHYAYPGRTGNIKFSLSVENGEITLIIRDSGIPFNPLSREDPDITLSAEEREIGGLGIMMVKKMMDRVDYRYTDGMNTMTVIKRYTQNES